MQGLNRYLRRWSYRVYRRSLKDARLRRPERCQGCARTPGRLDGHHPDYAKPLAVVWLCRGCHLRAHRH